MNLENSCPISSDIIDGNKTRIIAFFVIVITSIAVYCQNYYIIGLLGIDFAIRIFFNGKVSPLKYTANVISKLLHIKEKMENAAPKKFAAGIGMVFCIIIFFLQFFQLYLATNIVGAMLVFCASLECFFSFCLGCRIYIFLQIFRKKR